MEDEAMKNWLVEWEEYDPKSGKTIVDCDTWHTWADTIRIFNECVADELCHSATVYTFRDGEPYPSEGNNTILTYRP